jgi:hypothetical protein
MTTKKPAAKSAKKSITFTPRTRSAKKKATRKAKPSTVKRFQARADKRTNWAAQNPNMVPGELGKQATAKPAEPVVEAPVPVDEKKVEQAQEMAQAQAEAKAEMETEKEP